MVHTNIEVFDYLQPHYRWNLVAIAFCDRMLMVIISNGCSETESIDLKKYLRDNLFYQFESTNVYCRYKSRGGDFIKEQEFDKENGNSRKEMVERFIGRNILCQG